MGEVSKIEILLVEDNPGDADLFRRLVAGPCNITVAQTGTEAFDRLFQRGKFARSPKPNLVVVDINVPILSGFEILNILKGNSGLRSIPVIVWSGSQNEKDVKAAYEAGTCAFISKKSELMEMVATLSAFGNFWCKEVTFPGVNRTHTVGNAGTA